MEQNVTLGVEGKRAHAVQAEETWKKRQGRDLQDVVDENFCSSAEFSAASLRGAIPHGHTHGAAGLNRNRQGTPERE